MSNGKDFNITSACQIWRKKRLDSERWTATFGDGHIACYTLENLDGSPKNHPIEKESSLPFTSIFGFKMLIFRGVNLRTIKARINIYGADPHCFQCLRPKCLMTTHLGFWGGTLVRGQLKWWKSRWFQRYFGSRMIQLWYINTARSNSTTGQSSQCFVLRAFEGLKKSHSKKPTVFFAETSHASTDAVGR